MSIYIKGVEMPKHDDEYVIFTVYGDGGVVYGPPNRPHVRYKDRAVPIPPHGRLIDADALKVSLVFAEKTAEWAVPALRAVLMVIDEMPTIIPAQEGV